MNKRIEVNPKVMLGKPVIKGTRVPIYLIIKLVAQGMTYEEILEDYPCLSKKDIIAALEYAESILSKEEVFPVFRTKLEKV